MANSIKLRYVFPFQPFYKVNSKRCIKIIRATNLKLVKVSLKGSSEFTSNDKNFGPRGVVIISVFICNTVMPEGKNMGLPVVIDRNNLPFPFGIGPTDLLGGDDRSLLSWFLRACNHHYSPDFQA